MSNKDGKKADKSATEGEVTVSSNPLSNNDKPGESEDRRSPAGAGKRPDKKDAPKPAPKPAAKANGKAVKDADDKSASEKAEKSDKGGDDDKPAPKKAEKSDDGDEDDNGSVASDDDDNKSEDIEIRKKKAGGAGGDDDNKFVSQNCRFLTLEKCDAMSAKSKKKVKCTRRHFPKVRAASTLFTHYCQKGYSCDGKCQQIHAVNLGPKMRTVCVHYLKGSCKRGDECDFFHPRFSETFLDTTLKNLIKKDPSAARQMFDKMESLVKRYRATLEAVEKQLSDNDEPPAVSKKGKTSKSADDDEPKKGKKSKSSKPIVIINDDDEPESSGSDSDDKRKKSGRRLPPADDAGKPKSKSKRG